MDESVPPQPEDERGQRHQDAGHAEGPARTVLPEQPGGEERRKERAEVDGEIEPAEDPLQKVAVRVAELVAHVRRHAGLDAAGTDRDEGQTGQQPAPRCKRGRKQRLRQIHQGQAEVPEAVDDREQQDRQVFSQEGVGHDAADDREK